MSDQQTRNERHYRERKAEQKGPAPVTPVPVEGINLHPDAEFAPAPAKPALMWHWLTTAPSGRAHTHGADDGQTGWRLHAVYAASDATLESIRTQPAICGLVPGSGWGLDLFIEEKCKRCVRRMQKFGFPVESTKGSWPDYHR